MNYKKDYLYFAKCRKCIMDLVNDFYDENKIVRPRPDFVDYYAILYKKKDGSYININDSETKLREVTDYDNVEETYYCDLILEIDRIATTTQFNGQNLLDVTGGAVFIVGYDTKITESKFNNNYAINGDGGSIAIDGHSADILNNTFNENEAILGINYSILQIYWVN